MGASDALNEFEAELRRIAADVPAVFAGAKSEMALRHANATIVGPKGRLTELMKRLREVPGEHRRELGQRSNAIKNEMKTRFDEALGAVHQEARRAELDGAPLDISLPGRFSIRGGLHPITRIRYELLDIFGALGFEEAVGPEIDTHENCFDKLGFPPDHPATDMQDTFFVHLDEKDRKNSTLLRTHTSTIQVREMSRRQPPLAVVAPGAVYRRDDDATHSPMFFQLEGFLVDTDVSFADLKGVLTLFLQRLFDERVQVRFRPSYFPFVEPGGEVDISCVFCKAWEGNAEATAACRVCKGTGWLEILGCGMIHPVVFEHVGYDPDRYSGFAFGMGLDRIAMLKYGISNIKLLYENDMRFLSRF
ncbi:MAG: phenylalanine--tRNA ligase subunit alpha [Polyangiales bacterium]